MRGWSGVRWRSLGVVLCGAVLGLGAVVPVVPSLAQSSGCTSDDQCKGDRICVEGRCEDPGPLRGGSDRDCPGDLICVDHDGNVVVGNRPVNGAAFAGGLGMGQATENNERKGAD